MSNPLPAREEAWNCNRCRDNRVIVWNGVATPCDRCAGALPERVIKELRLVSWGPSSDGLGRLAEVGSLPLQGTEATEQGGAGAGSVGGPSHDTEPLQCNGVCGPYTDGLIAFPDPSCPLHDAQGRERGGGPECGQCDEPLMVNGNHASCPNGHRSLRCFCEAPKCNGWITTTKPEPKS